MLPYQRATFSSEREQRKIIIWTGSLSLVLVILILVTTTISVNQLWTKTTETIPTSHHSFHTLSKTASSSDVINDACQTTLYPAVCQSSVNSLAKRRPKNSKEVFDLAVQFAMEHAHHVRSMAYNLSLSHPHNPSAGKAFAMNDCLELLDISLDQLNDVLNPQKASLQDHEIDTWLSAAMTNQATCMDSLKEVDDLFSMSLMSSQVQNLTRFISNSLALHKSINIVGKTKSNKASRFPAWMTVMDRKLLEASPQDIKAAAVVAKDGSGTHNTIGEALAFVSLAISTGGSRSVIYVKAGVYKEYINIPTKQKNVMLMGDGKGLSVIVGSKNLADGYSTYQSATVGAMGSGFIAKGLSIINNSGPQKQQAVALRVGADTSVIYQCSIQGYQDTLYAHSNRQFYRDNDIYGTVDFIFGNAAAVFQNCFIQPRKPAGTGAQRNSITAQGRLDPNQNTGFSIHECKIQASSDVGGTPTYLGRPWHQYSRTVFMKSYLDGSINSAGWEQWSGNFALSTLYYGEYGNSGPGSSISGRVSWSGVHSSLGVSEASKFTVNNFIFGNAWLPPTGVPYDGGL